MSRILLFLYFISIFYRINCKYNLRKNQDCRICDKYNISLKNNLWWEWFKNDCYNLERRRQEREKMNICLYYDKRLNIYQENFWELWNSCNCDYISKDIEINLENFRGEL